MRVDRQSLLLLRALACVLLLGGLSLLAACPATGSGAGAGATTSGAYAGAGSPCGRNLKGDLKTARDRLERGHPDEAMIYVNAIRECPGNQESIEFLVLASEVYEEMGILNQGWWALCRALAKTSSDSDEQRMLLERVRRFEDSYVRLQTAGPESYPVDISYLGAILDDPTYELLKLVSANKGVDLGAGAWGFWLFPGRYEIMGKVHSLGGGQAVDLSERSVP